jgi:hypothetical protein
VDDFAATLRRLWIVDAEPARLRMSQQVSDSLNHVSGRTSAACKPGFIMTIARKGPERQTPVCGARQFPISLENESLVG